MKALIVHAHPEPLSMNAALTATAAETLRAHGYEVEVSDLYRQGFQAVASAADSTRLVDPGRLGYIHEQRHAAATRNYVREILDEQDPAKAAQAILGVLNEASPPTHLVLGSDAVRLVRAKVQALLAEIYEWERVSLSTDFEADR